MRDVLSALYLTLTASKFALRLIGKTIDFILPSGASLVILNDDEVPDFRIAEQKYWAIWFDIGGFKTPVMPLPKEDLLTVWQAIWKDNDIWIDGTEDTIKFYDEDTSTYEYGNTFSPNKQLGVFTHVAVDIALASALIAFCVLLQKLGIPKLVFRFVNNFKRATTQKKIHNMVDDIYDTVTDTNVNAEMLTLLRNISDKIGLRFTL